MGNQAGGPGADQQVPWPGAGLAETSWSSGEDQGQSVHKTGGAALPEASLSPPWELLAPALRAARDSAPIALTLLCL